jgi:uncharacterized membrane protein YsdA (DUF1294 family)
MAAREKVGGWLAARWAPALLTGVFVFVALTILDRWNIAPHQLWRAAVVGGASGFLATSLIRRFAAHSPQK